MALVSYSALPTGPGTGTAGANSSAGGQVEYEQFTATKTGTIDTIAWWLGASTAFTTLRFGIYSDSAGVPNTLLSPEWVATAAQCTFNAWNYFGSAFGGGVAVTSGTLYWLGHLSVGAAVNYSDNAATGGLVRDGSGSTATVMPASAGALNPSTFNNILNNGVMGNDGAPWIPRRMPLGV
jgi:hypothetical protein